MAVDRHAAIIDVGFKPPSPYRLDVEVFTLAEFRRRVSDAHLRKVQRVDFHILIYFAAGNCTHTIDFEPVPCTAGTLLVLQPGQLQRFDPTLATWDGWIVMCGPQFVRDTLDALNGDELLDVPNHHQVLGADRDVIVESIERMHADTMRAGEPRALNVLLHHELAALFARLRLCETKSGISSAGRSGANAALFRRFRKDVEQHLATLHRVSDYARLAGCSEKTLGRAVFAATGASAKAYLARRLTLEAKRLLPDSSLTIGAIAERLGFEEPSNFVKFFRREAGEAPGDFRRRTSNRQRPVPTWRPTARFTRR